MKRTLLLVTGAIGAAGMIAMAAPASADDGTTQSRQFQQNLQSQYTTFTDSIDPGKAVDAFLNGNCTPKCPVEDANPGFLHQFDVFGQSVQGQSKQFGDSGNLTKQLGTFAKSVTDPSSIPAKP